MLKLTCVTLLVRIEIRDLYSIIYVYIVYRYYIKLFLSTLLVCIVTYVLKKNYTFLAAVTALK